MSQGGQPPRLHRPELGLARRPEREPREPEVPARGRVPTPAAAPARGRSSWRRRLHRGRQRAGAELGSTSLRVETASECLVDRHGQPRRDRGGRTTARPPAQGHRNTARPVPLPRHAARIRGVVDAEEPVDVYQVGTTKSGPCSRANIYRYPEWAFRTAVRLHGAAPRWTRAGGEKLYATLVKTPIVNLGVAVDRSVRRTAIIDPFFLGSPDQNDVQGYAGTPVNVNGYMFDYHAESRRRRRGLPAAAALLGGRRLGLRPVHGPAIPRRLPAEAGGRTTSRRRPCGPSRRASRRGGRLIAARVVDRQSGLDPFSLVIAYNGVLVGAAAYDPASGLALLPATRAGTGDQAREDESGHGEASDNQEAKNIARHREQPDAEHRLPLLSSSAPYRARPSVADPARRSVREESRPPGRIRYFDRASVRSPLATTARS